jgi:hypothetical protein
MQGRGDLLRTLALLRVCSNTHDRETFNRSASSSGVRMSPGSNLGGLTVASFDAVAMPFSVHKLPGATRCQQCLPDMHLPLGLSSSNAISHAVGLHRPAKFALRSPDIL